MAVLGLLLGLPAQPALAAGDPQLTVTVTQRWQLSGTQGTWTPYVVTIRDTGTTGFTGDVFLVPSDSRSVAPNIYPVYRASITVARGSQRSTVFNVIDAQGGYVAEVRDPSGRVLAHADAGSPPRASSALGILSDLAQAEQKIAAPLRTLTRVDSSLTRFSSAQDFPTNAVYLSGLSGLVIDQFDSAALSQAQVQALKDYVGLGGTLITAGGPSWRRTLLSLPAELLPMHPTSTATASLSALADLAGHATDATAQVASGDVATGGRVTLVAGDGQPLVVEGVYGAGRIVELTFDPFAGPFDTQVDLAGMAWAHAISRALSGVQGGSRPVVAGGFGASANATGSGNTAAPGAWAPGFTTGSDQIGNILNDTPVAAAPPVGLLGGLLVAYVLLAGLLNYLFLKAMNRRPLMWISIPLIAVVFTAGAYGVGFGSRGSDFLVTEVQVQRLAPEGAVESYSFEGVYPPRKGDVTLALPGNTLVSTAVILNGLGDTRGGAVITTGSRPEVLLSNVSVWGIRPVQTLSVSHPYAYEPKQSMPLDAQLRVQKGRVVGKVVNLSPRPVSDVELVSASGSEAVLSPTLAPGASANVDVELSPGSNGPIANSRDIARAIPGVTENSRESMIRLASSQAISGAPGSLALVGFTRATDSITVDGAQPGRNAVAAVVEPITLQSADSLAGIAPRQRLVSNYGSPDGATQVDVYDFDLPPGLTTPTGLSYQMPDMQQPNVRSVEVYDWQAHAWRSLPKQPVSSRSQGPTPLKPGELAQGVVRVRVVEGFATNGANLAVGDQTS
ncbi:MAG TPA: hypothetical protein VOB72_20810 [Candidatus Dormibacteraeota bacterium]|nr:hypothetical protein [Candidatus Dormibacteraeota bacterium]